MNFEIFKYQ